MKSYIVLLIIVVLFGCSKGSKSSLALEEYQNWLIEHKEQILKTKGTDFLRISAQYLAADYLAFQDLKLSVGSVSQEALDSLSHEYLQTLSFQVNLEASSKENNLLYHKVNGYSEYKQRVNHLNFDLDTFLSLTVNDHRYKPLLGHFEGYHELSNRLIFHVTFKPEEYMNGKFDDTIDRLYLTFDDPYWETGINHFTFEREHIEQLPKIALSKL
ncbi:MAG: hypothetical protein AAF363_07865 [Bacteroidota bacterium]